MWKPLIALAMVALLAIVSFQAGRDYERLSAAMQFGVGHH